MLLRVRFATCYGRTSVRAGRAVIRTLPDRRRGRRWRGWWFFWHQIIIRSDHHATYTSRARWLSLVGQHNALGRRFSFTGVVFFQLVFVAFIGNGLVSRPAVHGVTRHRLGVSSRLWLVQLLFRMHQDTRLERPLADARGGCGPLAGKWFWVIVTVSGWRLRVARDIRRRLICAMLGSRGVGTGNRRRGTAFGTTIGSNRYKKARQGCIIVYLLARFKQPVVPITSVYTTEYIITMYPST